ncbi:MAG: peptide ABC transporter substrate-binding protein [Leptolyngbya foveolarum]|uniref:Peptide ABC transporter substrate-binding protein n=1 Tax=Leptolyngbya foveolarum TaxID=47253 RepID=A0A2W4V043_9CYAN|nr:MAG: peptide ABC transporter substrate-binding protein [Leptolyngbya foveolarum]
MKSFWLVRRLLSASLVGIPLVGLLWLGSCTRQPEKIDTVEEQANKEADESTLRLLYSRIPTTLNPHLANGFQDFEAARIVYEPLATYEENGDMVPVLAAVIPTPENGGLSKDGRTVTWKLKPDVRWSDGQPFTAEDVVFTYQFVTDPQVAAVTETYYEAIAKVEAVDPLTVKITFKAPNPSWALPFTGQNGMILPKHVFSQVLGGNVRVAPANLAPIGTGPYRFLTVADGVWTFGANEQYREGLPYFKIVELEGGLTPYVAARRVLRDGDADFAHNIQLNRRDRIDLAGAGQGTVSATFGSYVERVMLNLSDPDKVTKDGERSAVKNPHPFLSDVQVRKAIDYAINRDTIVDEVYGNAGQRTNQLLPFPQKYTNPALYYVYSPEQANKLLDKAGWVDSNNNGIRDKDGVEMRMAFQTPINPVRQRTQTLIKEDLAKVGIDVTIRRVIPEDFFSADPAQTRSLNHFYADMQEYNAGSDTPDPSIYMSWWLCDQVASIKNQWQKPNNARYCNPEYDKLWQQASRELNPEKRANLFAQMNTLLMQNVVVIPLVRRAVVNAVSDRLEGVDVTPWDASTWDIGTWRLVGAPGAEDETTEGKNSN